MMRLSASVSLPSFSIREMSLETTGRAGVSRSSLSALSLRRLRRLWLRLLFPYAAHWNDKHYSKKWTILQQVWAETTASNGRNNGKQWTKQRQVRDDPSLHFFPELLQFFLKNALWYAGIFVILH